MDPQRRDRQVRFRSFEFLTEQTTIHGETLPWSVLSAGFTFERQLVPLTSQLPRPTAVSQQILLFLAWGLKRPTASAKIGSPLIGGQMVKLEDVQAGTQVHGLTPYGAATVKALPWLGAKDRTCCVVGSLKWNRQSTDLLYRGESGFGQFYQVCTQQGAPTPSRHDHPVAHFPTASPTGSNR